MLKDIANKRKIILIIIAISFVIAVVYYYGSFFGFYNNTSSDIPTLGPDSLETKKKPEDPGGLVIPHSDSLIYESLKNNRAKQERINMLPSPENPLEIVRIEAEKHIFSDSIDAILDNIDSYEEEYTEESSKNDPDNIDYVIPNKMLTQKDEEEKQTYVVGSKLRILKSSENNYKFRSEQQDNTKIESGYKIQLASAYSYDEAQKIGKELLHKNRDILGDMNLIIRKIDSSKSSFKNDKIFFLVLVGNYKSISTTKLVCKKLLQKSQSCIITK